LDWTPGDVSSDIEDRRGSSYGGQDGGGDGFSFGGGSGLGIGGFVLLLAIGLITGHGFLGSLLGAASAAGSAGSPPPTQQMGSEALAPPQQSSAGEDRDVHLISFVLDDVQKTWTQIFAANGATYRHARLVLYRGTTNSGCGTARSSTGPFYCPQDEKVYIDLSFWDELKRFGGSTAEFAQAYVIAHELGHHVQKLLGIEGREQRAVAANPNERSPLSVDTELQADCFAGVWAHSTEQRGIVHSDDIASALSAAAAVGDDHIQRMSGRAVSPETWTHGSSAARQQWFEAGLNKGTVGACGTFAGKVAP
jgi:predicted metalloprotease